MSDHTDSALPQPAAAKAPSATGEPEDPPRLVLGTTPRQWALLGVVAAVLTALVVGGLIGRATDPVKGVSDPVDLGFARDMGVHHAQAVEMASIAYQRTEDPKLRYVAFDIMTTQQGQIGLMSGWLQLWNQTQTDSGQDSMAWMGEPHDGSMPGMATREQVAELRTLPVPQMDEQFLRLMIRHHRGALPMADYAAKKATSADIRDLAAKMSAGQSAEIDLLQTFLSNRGLPAEGEATGMHSPGSHVPAPSATPSPAATTTPSHSGHG